MLNKKTQGFTLIELLIVIAIIGILAAVLIPNLLSARERAYDTGSQSCASALAKGAEIFKIDQPNANYPTSAVLIADTAEYGTNVCTNANITVPAEAQTATTYSYTVQDGRGRNQYTITQNGLADPVAIP